jgi:streptogramin lyase
VTNDPRTKVPRAVSETRSGCAATRRRRTGTRGEETSTSWHGTHASEIRRWNRTPVPQPSSASEFTTSTPASRPDVVTAGQDGNVWFTEDIGKVGRVTPNGVITEFPLTNAAAFPVGIVTGPDGNIWFAEKSANKVARMTTAGVITEFQIPIAAAAPDKITVGADGNLWFTEHGAHQVAHYRAGLERPGEHCGD